MKLDTILSNPQSNFSVGDVSEALRVSHNTVVKWIYAGNLNAEKVSYVWVIRGSWVREYILNNQRGGFKSINDILKDYKLPFERDGNK